MRPCERCHRWHSGVDSAVCEACWKDMGQMAMEFDDEADEYDPDVETMFER